MTKRFLKDNRGQVLYAVLVTVRFMGVLSMITMGLTLKNYNAALNKQQHVSDYYAADAVAELIRIGKVTVDNNGEPVIVSFDDEPVKVTNTDDGTYTIVTDTATIVTKINTENGKFERWEVRYHAAETEADNEQPAT